jgi:parallel beta-helix repeat protein
MPLALSKLFVVNLLTCLQIVCVGCGRNDSNRITRERLPQVIFIDSNQGDDSNDGLSIETAWETFSKLDKTGLVPGDTLKFKRGSNFNSTLYINDSGEKEKHIVLTSYGDSFLDAPKFTNAVFDPDKKVYGNCIRLKGSYIIVENLFFEHTAAELSGNIGFTTMWELGAIYVDKTANNCIVRNNELFDCGVGIKSYGSHTLIENNYIHDCNRVLKEWSWGPIGIWIGGDYQEVCYNRIFNYSVVDPRINWGPGSYGDGADGGAIEIDDGRVTKSNIEIHHNYSRDNQGFIEVTWTDVVQNPPYSGFLIHHNVSDDYQQFIALWCGSVCRIENNTIIRRKVNANDWGVFNITQYNSRNLIRNNIVVVEKDVIIFNVGRDGNAQPNNVIENNLYFNASGNLKIGMEGPGKAAVFDNPEFLNYGIGLLASDFSITGLSPAIDKGLDLKYQFDFAGVSIPQGKSADIGAFEYFVSKGYNNLK